MPLAMKIIALVCSICPSSPSFTKKPPMPPIARNANENNERIPAIKLQKHAPIPLAQHSKNSHMF